MLAATSAGGHGWRVIYLGPNLPAEELARAAQIAKADAVALSIVYPTDDPRIASELRTLRSLLPPQVGLVIGGSGASAYAVALRGIGADALSSVTDLRHWLRARATAVLARP
jgi:methylmalonyl-CoA mutase cobalamin-binding subunit